MHLKAMGKALNKKIGKSESPVTRFTPSINNLRGKPNLGPVRVGRVIGVKKSDPMKKEYKVPSTPKVSGEKWGG